VPGKRKFVLSILFVIAVAGGLVGSSFALGLQPRLGLDLRGGVALTLTAPEQTRDDVLDKTVEVLQRRIDQAGVAEPEISREGSNNVFIQLPGTDDPQRLLDLIGRTAQLQFRQVIDIIPTGHPAYATSTVTATDSAEEQVIYEDSEGAKYVLEPAALTGAAVRDGAAILDPSGVNWQVTARFDREGASTWEEFTGRLACLPIGDPQRQVAIVLDRVVESSPQIGDDVSCDVGITGGDTVITGSFTEEEARDLAIVLTTGALPVELEQSEVRLVSPTLGSDSLRAGLIAGGAGLAMVMVYVLLYYRSLGLQTWLTYIIFAALVYGLIVVLGQAIGWSLTLAGIAGLIVSIGIATDSNIVFFERIKEELHSGRTIRVAISKGFVPAWRTLKAANFVTILAAIVLYFLTVGPVRGFALALGVATTIDLAITLGLTYPVASLLGDSKFFSDAPLIGMKRALEGGKRKGSLMSRISRSEFKINFIGRSRVWALISGALLVISVLALIPSVRGLTFGIDFLGGNIFRSPAPSGLEVQEVRSALREAGHADAVVQVITERASGRRQVQIQTPAIDDPDERAEILEAISSVTGADDAEIDVQSVGEKWGQEITNKALRGLLVFLVLVSLFMSLRLEPKMALAGLAALLHDLVITAGIYAIVGFEVTPSTVIATLTILGYSLYDTVVVFDKVQENVAIPSNARRSLPDIVNDSVNQVLMRSINTTLTTLIPVGSLLFVGSALLGADTLKDLALALFIGVAIGTYSSIFVAAPLVSRLKESEPRYASVRARVREEGPSRDDRSKRTPDAVRGDEGEQEVDGDVDEADGVDDAPVEAPVDRSAIVRAQPKRQSRAQRKKKKRS
jgi:protein-export membrane protein SecD/preprotein translocase SecF subunit